MAQATNIAVSALSALQRKLEVTANNIANVNTDGFKKSRAVFQTQDSPGVSVSIEQINTPGILRPDGREMSNVSLEEEFVNLITTRHTYTANLKVIETETKMLGTILDLFV